MGYFCLNVYTFGFQNQNYMKYLLILLAPLVVFIGCTNPKEKEKNPLADSLAKVNSDLANQLSQKDSTVRMFMGSFNEIQDNLDSIKQKEKLIVNASRSQDVANKKEEIKADIRAIYELMAKSRGSMDALRGRLAMAAKDKIKADTLMAEMQRTIDRLTQQLDAKDKEIAELKTQLEKLKMDFDAVTANLKNKEDESAARLAELNTAYYIVGTEQELKEKGIIQKTGGFIGIGKSTTVKNNFKRDNFIKVDITNTSSIPLQALKAEVLTNHPEGAYSLDGDKKTINQLSISNAKNFWSSSKFLVIKVKK